MEDIQRLVDARVCEDHHIDYKRDLPNWSNAQDPDHVRVDFLRDVSAFANADGGWLIYGVAEKNGVPGDIPGVSGKNRERDVRRLEDTLRNGLEPAYTGLRARYIDRGAGDQPVLVLQVRKSLSGPHAVKRSKDFFEFKYRGNGKNESMDLTTLRRAMLEGELYGREADEFREHRVKVVTAGNQSPRVNVGSGYLLLHVLPLGRLRERVGVQPPPGEWSSHLKSSAGVMRINRPNLEGWLEFAPGDGKSEHIQLFQNGGVEIGLALERWKVPQNPSFLDAAIEDEIVAWTTRAVQFMEQRSVAPPYAIYLSLLGVCGLRLLPESRLGGSGGFDRPDLCFPVFILDDTEGSIPGRLRGFIDMMWYAAGSANGSPDYNASGDWATT